MKDYSRNYNEARKFIKSYKIENGEIIIQYASGETKTVQFKQQTEKGILEQMECQAKYASAKPLTGPELFFAFAQPLFFALSVYNASTATSYKPLLIGVSLVTAFGAIYYPGKAINYVLKQKELKKLNYFLDNKDELNSSLANPSIRKHNFTEGVSRKAFKQIESELSSRHNTDTINMNNIDSYSLDDLKTMKNNLQKLKEMGKIPSEKTNVKTLKPAKKKAVAVSIFADEIKKDC